MGWAQVHLLDIGGNPVNGSLKGVGNISVAISGNSSFDWTIAGTTSLPLHYTASFTDLVLHSNTFDGTSTAIAPTVGSYSLTLDCPEAASLNSTSKQFHVLPGGAYALTVNVSSIQVASAIKKFKCELITWKVFF